MEQPSRASPFSSNFKFSTFNFKFSLMKKIINNILLLTICAALMFSCGGDDDGGTTEMTDQQKAAKTLKEGSPWEISSVDSKPDGADAEALNGLKLSFGISGTGVDIAPTTFTSTGVEALASDPGATWSWDGGSVSTINLNGGFAPELTNIQFTPGIENATSIQVTFALSNIGGRRKGVGEYTVTLEK
jgi:hypothetical protein